jgi:hypothetical protein
LVDWAVAEEGDDVVAEVAVDVLARRALAASALAVLDVAGAQFGNGERLAHDGLVVFGLEDEAAQLDFGLGLGEAGALAALAFGAEVALDAASGGVPGAVPDLRAVGESAHEQAAGAAIRLTERTVRSGLVRLVRGIRSSPGL